MAAIGKKFLDMKSLLRSVVFGNDVLPPYAKSDLLDIVEKQPDHFVFPNRAVMPSQPAVFCNGEEIGRIGSVEIRLDFDEEGYQKWLSDVLRDFANYSTENEMRLAISEYGQKHQITDFAAGLLFKWWLLRLTFLGILSGYAGDGVAANLDYFWRQPEAWVWFWQDDFTPDETIIEDIIAGQ